MMPNKKCVEVFKEASKINNLTSNISVKVEVLKVKSLLLMADALYCVAQNIEKQTITLKEEG